MSKKRFVLIVYIFCYIFSNLGQYHAVYIPDDKLSEIVLDGNLDDWNWVPDKYVITNENMVDIGAPFEEFTQGDCDIKIMIGWNKRKNWLYINASIKDDFIKSKRIPYDLGNVVFSDVLKIAVDANNSGGLYASRQESSFIFKSNAIQYYFTGPMKNGIDEIGNWVENKWIVQKGPHINWGTKSTLNNDGTYTTNFEIGMALWESIDVLPITSKRYYLTENEIVGLTISFYDNDKVGDRSKWCILSGPQFAYNASDFSKLVLDSPITDENTWQGVMKILTPY